MFNRKSIYALNKKDPNAIVYPDANGDLHRLTRDCFESEEEFLLWKSWSDDDLHTEDNRDVAEDKRSISLDGLSEEALTVPAVDAVIESHHVQAEKQRGELEQVVRIKGMLTEIQFRRLWLHEVEGKTLEEIATREDVAFQSVHESIESAKKKILRKF